MRVARAPDQFFRFLKAIHDRCENVRELCTELVGSGGIQRQIIVVHLQNTNSAMSRRRSFQLTEYF